MGLIINQRAPHITLPKLLEQLEITAGSSHPVAARGASMAVHCGGPVETSRGFVLHSSDYFAADSTLPINESMCLTATVDILRAIAKGSGPDKAILALGYAGWAPGQLEHEIQSNGWLNCPADYDVVFDGDLENKYARALEGSGRAPVAPRRHLRPRIALAWIFSPALDYPDVCARRLFAPAVLPQRRPCGGRTILTHCSCD